MRRGFTLLEMLVVLVILGMAAALVVPSLARTFDRVRHAGERDDVTRRLALLSSAARLQGEAVSWRAGEPIAMAALPWPSGWRVHAVTPLRVESNGFCGGGDVSVRGPEDERRYRLQAPDCTVVDPDAP